MGWNYRVVRQKHETPIGDTIRTFYTYEIHEAYYDDTDHVVAITENAVNPFGENIRELRTSWVMMAEAFGKPILDSDKIPEDGYNPKNPFTDESDDFEKMSNEEKEELIKKEEEELAKSDWKEFDSKAYEQECENERLNEEVVHNEKFVGTPLFSELFSKLITEYEIFSKTKQEGV